MKSPFPKQSNSNTENQTYSNKTPSDFWKTIRTNIKSQHQAPPIKPVSRSKNLLLSFAQERLWIIDQLRPDTSIHNMRAALRLKGSLNIAILEQSLREIVRRHEILRTTFTTVNEKPIQVISPNIDIKLSMIDFREIPESEQKIQIEQITKQEFEQPFDLALAPLWRFKLMRLSEEEYVFLRTVHHIVFDGWSYSVFMRELAVIYESLSSGMPLPFGDLPIQYADFAQSQRQWLQDKVLESQLNYWKQQLSGSLSSLKLPLDYSRPSIPTFQGNRQSLMLPKNLVKRVKELSVKEEVSLFVTLLSAFKMLLYQYTKQEDIIICSPVAGRNQVETKKLIGYFNNILPMRTSLEGNPSFLELMDRVSKVTLGAYEHQELPFQKLANCINILNIPLYRVVFALQNTPSQPLKLGEVDISYLDVDTEASNFEMFLSIAEKEENLTATLSYKTDLFSANTVTQILENFQTLLEDLVINPNQHLSDLPVLRNSRSYQFVNSNGNFDKTKQKPDNTFVAPRNELEVQITKIWKKVLKVNSIGVEDNFWALGGNSLQAVSLFAEIEKKFGKNLPLATLFQAASVAELASIIRQKNWLAPWDSLVAIQPHGSKPPIFYIHPIGANLLIYRDLAKRLGAEQPVYGLQPRGLDGSCAPLTRIEDMADHYLAQISQIEPNGPYLLAGLSQGGTIAWEISQRLTAQGKEVALLALLDTYGGFESRKVLPPITRLLSVLSWAIYDFVARQIRLPLRIVDNFIQLGAKETTSKMIRGLFRIVGKEIDSSQKKINLKLKEELKENIDEYRFHSGNISYLEKWINSFVIFILNKSSKPYYATMFTNSLAFTTKTSLPKELQKVQEANMQAGKDYIPQVFPGRAILFRATERPPGICFDPKLGWGDMASEGLEIYDVPGSHGSIVKSPVLAKKLKECIEEALEKCD